MIHLVRETSCEITFFFSMSKKLSTLRFWHINLGSTQNLIAIYYESSSTTKLAHFHLRNDVQSAQAASESTSILVVEVNTAFRRYLKTLTIALK